MNSTFVTASLLTCLGLGSFCNAFAAGPVTTEVPWCPKLAGVLNTATYVEEVDGKGNKTGVAWWDVYRKAPTKYYWETLLVRVYDKVADEKAALKLGQEILDLSFYANAKAFTQQNGDGSSYYQCQNFIDRSVKPYHDKDFIALLTYNIEPQGSQNRVGAKGLQGDQRRIVQNMLR